MKGTIGVILTDYAKQGLQHAFFAGVLEGFRQKCNESDYCISFLNSVRNKNSGDTYLDQAKKDGYSAIFIACAEPDEEIMQLVRSDIIVGTIDQEFEGVINVSSDNSLGMKALMEYILEMGHRKIAIITGDNNLVSSIRVNEYIKALENHGIAINDDYIQRGHFREINLTSFLTEKLLKMDEVPSCIIFPDDYAAIGGINSIRARGLDIPRDISIAGYDGDVVMSQLEPALTSVAQDTYLMGQTIAEKLIQAIEHPETKTGSTQMVNTHLQVGRSVGRVYE